MINRFQLKNALSLLLVMSLTACVSASRYNDLQTDQDKTKAALVVCEADRADLQRRLGITSSEKTELEGSMATLRRAVSELEARKAETERHLAEFRELTEKFKGLVDAGKLSIKVRNGRMMLALSSDILFASGSAKLSKDGEKSIAEVAQLLKDLKNRNFQIEGHTDNVPIRTAKFPSNWELASARAGSVLATMLAAGFPPEHVSTASYGQFDPLNDNSTGEARAENRRIAIVVVPDLSGLPGFDELNRMSSSVSSSSSKATPMSTPAAPSTLPTAEANWPTHTDATDTSRAIAPPHPMDPKNANEPSMSAVPEITAKGTPEPQKLPDLSPTETEVKIAPSNSVK